MKKWLLTRFQQLLKDRFVQNKEVLKEYSADEGYLEGKTAEALLFPCSVKEVSAIVELCHKNNLPFFVRGAGTGKSGGMLLTKKGILICLDRMNKIEIDEQNLLAKVEAGVITGDLQKEVEEKGLFYPVDPASLDKSSIGGNIAENAGGPRAFKYGVTGDYVLGLEVVLPNGEIVELGGMTRKNVTGYALKDLLIGSEGTLGIVCSAYLKLLPAPKFRKLIWAGFDDFMKAVVAISKVYQSGITPSTIEFAEKRAFKAVEQVFKIESFPFDLGKEAHLLIELDAFSLEELDRIQKGLLNILQEDSLCVVFESDQEQERVWNLRRKISEATKELSFHKKSEDVVVPASFLRSFLEKIKAIENLYGVEIICFGHLGDGNIHVNILNTQDESGFIWEKFQDKVVANIFQETFKHKGALSGEHGIGLSKRDYLDIFLSKRQIDINKKIKKIFDPKGLLNPGKIWKK